MISHEANQSKWISLFSGPISKMGNAQAKAALSL